MIKPYLRNLINDHKSIMELNIIIINNNNNNNNNNNIKELYTQKKVKYEPSG